MPNNPEWFYEVGGQRVGPVTLDIARQCYQDGAIGPSSLVWCPNFKGQWKAAAQTDIALRDLPPPLPTDINPVASQQTAPQTPMSTSDKVAIQAMLTAAAGTFAFYLWWSGGHWIIYLIVFLFLFFPNFTGMMKGTALRQVVNVNDRRER